MYATLAPHLREDTKEMDIISFGWEDQLVKKLTEEEKAKALEDHNASEAFWDKWDKRKLGSA